MTSSISTMQSNISKSQWALFISLYTTQYVGVGFMLVALVGILRQRGMALEDLSIVYVIGIPWILKFIWAPIVDRFGYQKWGHYRSWLLVLQFLMVVFLCLISQFSLDNQLMQIAIFGMVFVFFSATQDVAVDALASREFNKEQRSIINGVQLAGGLLGNVIGGGLVLILYPHIGWRGAFFLMAGVTSISWFQLLFFREKANTTAKNSPTVAQTFKHLVLFWRGKVLWLLLVSVSGIGISMIYAILTPMMMDAGKSLADVGLALNIFGTGIGVFFGLLAGRLIQKLGRMKALQAFFLLQIGCYLAMLAVLHVTNTVNPIIMLYFIIYPLVATIMSTLMMDYASQDANSGTTYTVQYAVSFFISMLMASMGLQIAERYGYGGVIVVAVSMAILALVVAGIYAKKSSIHNVPLNSD